MSVTCPRAWPWERPSSSRRASPATRRPPLSGACCAARRGWPMAGYPMASRLKSGLRWESHRRAFEGYLQGLRFTGEPRLASLEEAMRYSMLAGGKRVRPTLCMETAWVFGDEPAHVLPSAAAIELIHTYSPIHADLAAMDPDAHPPARAAAGPAPPPAPPPAAPIALTPPPPLTHDDLPAMDDDDYRRGRPTAHKKFGEAMAILAGDAFFGEALTLITVHQQAGIDQVLEVVRELADSTGVNGMVGGQVMDMEQTGAGDGTDAATLHLIPKFKTAPPTKPLGRPRAPPPRAP